MVCETASCRRGPLICSCQIPFHCKIKTLSRKHLCKSKRVLGKIKLTSVFPNISLYLMVPQNSSDSNRYIILLTAPSLVIHILSHEAAATPSHTAFVPLLPDHLCTPLLTHPQTPSLSLPPGSSPLSTCCLPCEHLGLANFCWFPH